MKMVLKEFQKCRKKLHIQRKLETGKYIFGKAPEKHDNGGGLPLPGV